VPERERELRGLAEGEKVAEVVASEGDNYDIIAESKKKLAGKLKEQKEFAQISKSVMSNKNKKLLKAI
jgi:hypothetical protein